MANEDRPAFYFTPPPIAQRLDLVQYLVEYSGQVLLVVGERGSGKTVMLRELLTRAGDLWRTCHVEATPMLDSHALQRQIATAFELTQAREDLGGDREGLQAQLDTYERANLIPVLLVDDAHELPAESLRLLFSLAHTEPQRARLHVLLFCEPQIHGMLNTPQLRSLKDSILHVVEIPALTLEQTRDYLEQGSLGQSVGDDFPFSERDLRRLYTKSKGLPGHINALARQALERSPPQRDGRASAMAPWLRHKRQLFMLAGVLGLGSLVIVLNSLIEGPGDLEQTAPVPLPVPPSLPAGDGATQPAQKAQSSPGGRAPPAAPLDEQVAQGGDAPHSSPSIPKTAGRAEQSSPPAADAQGATTPAAAGDAGTPPPSAPGKTAKAEAGKPTHPSKPLPSQTLPPPASNDLPGIHGEDWVRSQRPDHYVLQLFGTHDKAALGKFVAQYRLHDQVGWLTTKRNGRNWFVLIYGPFPDRGKAIAAISSLPPGIQALKPWARPVSAVHAALGGAR